MQGGRAISHTQVGGRQRRNYAKGHRYFADIQGKYDRGRSWCERATSHLGKYEDATGLGVGITEECVSNLATIGLQADRQE